MILVDADVLPALVNRGHPEHRRCVEALRLLEEPLGTVWPALAAALAATDGLPLAQAAILEMVERGSLRLVEFGRDDLAAVRRMRAKRPAKPLGLVQAALVRAAERDGVARILSLAKAGLATRRLAGGRRLCVIPGDRGRASQARRGEGKRAGRAYVT